MLHLLYCGHDSNHSTPFEIHRPNGVPHYILLLVKTDAFFYVDGQRQPTAPMMAILYNRYIPMHYGSEHPGFNDDWVHFDIDDETEFFNTFTLPFNTPIYLSSLSPMTNYTRLLVGQSLTPGKHQQSLHDATLRLLLYSLDQAYNAQHSFPLKHSKHRSRLEQLRIHIHNSPNEEWTIERMASMVHMSSSYLQHLYKDIFGISCIQEVISARIERAKFYLSATSMTMTQVATHCGYENDLHFMRQFKKQEGLTPTQYRLTYATGSFDD